MILRAGRRSTENGDEKPITDDWLRRTFEQAPVGMALLEPSGEFVEANLAIVELFGGEPTHLLGASARDIIYPDDQAEFDQAWLELETSETHSVKARVRCLASGGRTMRATVTISLVAGVSGQPSMVSLRIEDDTAEHANQERLETLVSGKDRFVEAIGTEIKDPLNSIIELVNDANADVANGRLLKAIEANARDIEAIIDDLIVSAQAGYSQVPFIPVSIDVETLTRDVMAQIPGAEHLPLISEADLLWADRGRTRQILRLLISNAVSYGGAAIELKTMTSGPDTVLHVIDNGPEIPRSERERIFSSDLRRGRPVTRPARVGLGLTVGRDLARQMGGEVSYERTLEGWNVFELRLPSEPLTDLFNPRTALGLKQVVPT